MTRDFRRIERLGPVMPPEDGPTYPGWQTTPARNRACAPLSIRASDSVGVPSSGSRLLPQHRCCGRHPSRSRSAPTRASVPAPPERPSGRSAPRRSTGQRLLRRARTEPGSPRDRTDRCSGQRARLARSRPVRPAIPSRPMSPLRRSSPSPGALHDRAPSILLPCVTAQHEVIASSTNRDAGRLASEQASGLGPAKRRACPRRHEEAPGDLSTGRRVLALSRTRSPSLRHSRRRRRRRRSP